MFKLLFPVLVLFCSVPAFACSCAKPGSPDVAYARADVVFVATIDVTRRATTGQGMEFHFTRGKSWKGNAPAAFDVQRNPCSMEDVQSGAEYLVYAGANLEVSMCNRRKLLKRARIEVQYLDALNAGTKADLATGLPGALVSGQDEDLRVEAAELIGEVMRLDRDGSSRAGFVSVLAQGARDPSEAVRLASVQALGPYRTDGGRDTFIVALQDADRGVRAAAVSTLGMILRGDSVMFQALKASLKLARENPDPNREQQETLLSSFARPLPGSAATELEKIEAEQLLLGLIDEIHEPWKRVAPVQHLGMMGTRARGAAPKFLQVLKSADYYSLKQYTIIALGDVGAVDMQSGIEPYLKDKDCSVAAAVVKAVWKMNKAGFGKFFAEKGMPELKSRFDSCDSPFIYALQDLGSAGRDMEPFLAQKYAAMPDSDSSKERVKALLDAWRNAR